MIQCADGTRFTFEAFAEIALRKALTATSRFNRASLARYTSPIAPAPMGASISCGPSLSPAESGICRIQLNLADQGADTSWMTRHLDRTRLRQHWEEPDGTAPSKRRALYGRL